MKRYLLFAGSTYYPLGGWKDFFGSFDSLADALIAFADIVTTKRAMDWYQIVDLVEEKIVQNGGRIDP